MYTEPDEIKTSKALPPSSSELREYLKTIGHDEAHAPSVQLGINHAQLFKSWHLKNHVEPELKKPLFKN